MVSFTKPIRLSIRITALLVLPVLSFLSAVCIQSTSKDEESMTAMVAFTATSPTGGGGETATPPTGGGVIQLAINGDYREDYEFNGPDANDIIHRVHASFSSGTGYAGTWNSETPWGNPERTVLEFDNTTRTAYVDCPTCWVPGISRMVWTVYNGDLYYCEIVYGQATLADAKADPTTANPTNPTLSNTCGFSYWSRLDPL